MTMIMAHRGSSGTHPENTLAAIKEAVKAGADSIEIDVQLTQDNIPIVMHDKDVNRMTNGKGLIRSFTYEEIKKLHIKRSGWRAVLPMKIPSFQEVLDALKETPILLNIELKTDEFDYPGIEKIVLDLCNAQGGKTKFLFSSFNPETLKRVRALDPVADLALITGRDLKTLAEIQQSMEIQAIHPDKRTLGDPLLAGLKVRYWTVNKEADIRKFLLSGADGIITDYPARAKEVQTKLADQ